MPEAVITAIIVIPAHVTVTVISNVIQKLKGNSESRIHAQQQEKHPALVLVM